MNVLATSFLVMGVVKLNQSSYFDEEEILGSPYLKNEHKEATHPTQYFPKDPSLQTLFRMDLFSPIP